MFLFPLFISIMICGLLTLISEMLSIIFSFIVTGYIIYSITNKRARKIRNEIKKEREKIFIEYKKEYVDDQEKFKNFSLPSGKNVEYIDFNTKTFFILRPYAENVNKKYEKEIKNI